MPATVFHIQAPATLGELDDALVDAVEVWRHATRMLQFRDDRLNRAAVEAARGRVDGLLERRHALTTAQ